MTPIEAPDAEPLDEGGVDVGVLLHLEHGRHAAAQELGVGERPDRQTLLTRDDGRHGEVLAGHAAQAGVLGPPPEERVADVGVAAHEARDHDFAPAIEHSGRRRMPARRRRRSVRRRRCAGPRRTPRPGSRMRRWGSTVITVASRIRTLMGGSSASSRRAGRGRSGRGSARGPAPMVPRAGRRRRRVPSRARGRSISRGVPARAGGVGIGRRDRQSRGSTNSEEDRSPSGGTGRSRARRRS